METTTVNVTPDKSLIQKLGRIGYSTGQAIAELVDNAIDARRIGETERVEITLDSARGRIIIVDDGRGMNVEELESAWTIAKSGNSKGKIGKFGMGLKSASSALGRVVEVKTKKIEEGQELVLAYDEEKWIADKSAAWDRVFVERRDAEASKHGTQITISCLNVSLYHGLAEKLLKDFGRRYGPYIEKHEVQISINKDICQAIQPDIEEGTKRDIDIITYDGSRIRGWIALLKKRSIRGEYGIHLYAHNRLIKPYAKFGIREHPEVARVIGSVSLENIPVNVFKTEFITESQAYIHTEEVFKEDSTVKEILRMANERKRKQHDIKAIMNSTEDQTKHRLLRLGEQESQKLLDSVTEIPIETEFGKIIMILSDTEPGIYRVARQGNVTEIIVNRRSSVFRAFRNPLIFLLMLRIEVETFPQELQIEKYVKARNALWETHIASKIGHRHGKQSADNLKLLADSLIGLYEHLESFPHKFQFTALSTLGRFLHNAHKKMIYTIYTTTGVGDYLEDAILEHGQFAVLRDPSKTQFTTVLRLTGEKNIIVIREYAKIPNSRIATIEKSWVDLYFEVMNCGMVQYTEELEMINDLIILSYATKKKIITQARHRKMTSGVEKYMERVL